MSRTTFWLLAAVLACALPAIAPAPAAHAQPDSSAAPVPNAIAVVKGTRPGKSGPQEVDRWAGEIEWQGALPVQLVARYRSGQWTWHPFKPAQLQIQALGLRLHGKSIEDWARHVKARDVLVIIVARPGPHGSGATRRSPASRRSSRAREQQPPPTEFETDTRFADTARDSDDADDRAREIAETPQGTEPHNGLGERGTGRGRGLRGTDAHDGLGTDEGRRGGYQHGSTRPSHVHNKRADLSTEGGRIPKAGGKRHGSAAGTQGATGHIHGPGWFALIDAPDNIAPLINAGLILTDANILGFGHKMLSRIVRGLAMDKLRRALSKDAARIIAHDMAKVRDQLARQPRYQKLPKNRQQAILASTEATMTRTYFARARQLFSDRARMFDDVATRHASRAGQTNIHSVSTENAAAYRKIASAADAERARLPAHAPASTRPAQLGPRKSARVTRKTPGTATGGRSLKPASGNWLRGTHRNAAPLPGQVADALRGRTFASWDAMRREVWKTIAADKALHGPFDARDLKRMRIGFAPEVHKSQTVGKLKRYVLHHKTPIQHGGGVYDLDNVVVVTPRYHKEILDPGHHMGSRKK